jgi:hypothetical protein
MSYNPGQTALSYPSKWGTWYYPKLSAALTGAGKCTIAVLGDSIGRGYFTSNLNTKGYVSLLRAALQGSHGSAADGGSGWQGICDTAVWAASDSVNSTASAAYVTAGNYAATTGTWAVNTAHAAGPGGNMLLTTSDTTPATITFIGRGSTFTIYTLATGGGTANWEYTIDGGSAVTVSDNTTGIQATQVTGLTNASHTVVIKYNDAGTKVLYLSGIRFENTTGVVIDNYSIFAQQSSIWTTSTSLAANQHSADWACGAQRPADLLIYAMGVNDDHIGNVAALTYIETVGQTYYYAKDNANNAGGVLTGNTDILYIFNHIGNDDTNHLWPQYAALIRSLNMSYNAAVLDLGNNFANSYNNAANNNYWCVEDGTGNTGTSNVHPGDAGNALIYALMAPLLIP